MKVKPRLEHHDVVVVGAGQAGLAVSWYLLLFGVDHVVLERGGVGQSWSSARWDSFTPVTPAWMTRLPGLVPRPGTGETFTPRRDVVALVEPTRRRCRSGPVSRSALCTGEVSATG
jgi:putative flavoprotein involved in K+ transport